MIHAYEFHGSHIILDVNSGSVHVTDPVAFYAITHWGSPGKNSPNNSPARTSMACSRIYKRS